MNDIPLDQLFTGALANTFLALMLVAGSFVSVAVALVRFLHGARLRSLATAASTALADSQMKESFERRLHRSLMRGLKKRDGFVEEYSAATRFHRWAFLVGSACSIACLVVLAAVFGHEVIASAVEDLSADSVIAYSYGFGFFAVDFGMNAIAVIPLSISVAILFYGFSHVYSRMHVVWQLERRRNGVSEPISLGRYDVLVSTIGVVFPVVVTGLVLALFYYSGVYQGIKGRVHENYERILDEVEEGDIAASRLEALVGYHANADAQKKLASAAVIDEFLRRYETSDVDTESEAAGITQVLQTISADLSRELLDQKYYLGRSGHLLLKEGLADPLDQLRKLLNQGGLGYPG